MRKSKEWQGGDEAPQWSAANKTEEEMGLVEWFAVDFLLKLIWRDTSKSRICVLTGAVGKWRRTGSFSHACGARRLAGRPALSFGEESDEVFEASDIFTQDKTDLSNSTEYLATSQVLSYCPF